MVIYGGLLVGGASRRMGRPKALVEVGDMALAERAAAALAPHVERVLLLGAGPVPASLAGLERIADATLPGLPQDGGRFGPGRRSEDAAATTEAGEVAAGGPLAGLLAALRRAPEATWVLCSCDLPAITPEAIAWLVAQRRPERLAVLPRLASDAPPEPLLALYEPGIRPAVEALAARGVRAPWRLAGAAGVAQVVVPPRLAACWRDADRPDELPRPPSSPPAGTADGSPGEQAERPGGNRRPGRSVERP